MLSEPAVANSNTENDETNDFLSYFTSFGKKIEEGLKLMTVDIKWKSDLLKKTVDEHISKFSATLSAAFVAVGSNIKRYIVFTLFCSSSTFLRNRR